MQVKHRCITNTSMNPFTQLHLVGLHGSCSPTILRSRRAMSTPEGAWN